MPQAESADAIAAAENLLGRLARRYAEAGEAASGVLETQTREFAAGVAAASLLGAEAALGALHAVAAGARGEAGAIEIPGRARCFRVDLPEMDPRTGSAFALATIRGEDRFLTVVRASPEREGTARTFAVARWKPPLPEGRRGAPGQAHAGADDAEEAVRLLRLARGTSTHAAPDSRWDLAAAAREMARGRFSGVDLVASVSSLAFASRSGGVFQSVHAEALAPAWERYAAAMRPVLAPALQHVERGAIGLGGMGIHPLAARAVAADGGFAGPVCERAGRLLREGVAGMRLRGRAGDFARLGDDVIEAGFAWGRAWLAYGDLDRETFAVEGPVPGAPGTRVGRYHRNADLACDHQAHVAVVDRDASGAVSRIEIHLAHLPPAQALEYDPSSLEETWRVFADESADPPRLTRRTLAERIQAGDPLPAPAAGFDFKTGSLLPGTADDADLALSNAFYGLSEDRWAMSNLAEARDGWAESWDFTEEGEAPPEQRPGACPRP